jgi:hypothetical protein
MKKGLMVLFLNFLTCVCFSQSYISLTTNSNYPINKMWLDGRYNIMGWSRDGKMAYAYYAPPRPRPQSYTGFDRPKSLASVVVYDLVEDERIATVSKDYYNISYKELENFWVEFEDEITNMLQENNIVSFPDSEMLKMDTLKSNYGLEYTFEVITESIIDEETYLRRMYEVETLYFTVKNQENKTKIISRGPTWLHSDNVLGYYKSPFENRIAFYIRLDENAIAHTGRRYEFIGCHLTAGFQ